MASIVVKKREPTYNAFQWTGTNLAQAKKWRKDLKDKTLDLPVEVVERGEKNYLHVTDLNGKYFFVEPTDWILRDTITHEYFKVSEAEYTAKFETL